MPIKRCPVGVTSALPASAAAVMDARSARLSIANMIDDARWRPAKMIFGDASGSYPSRFLMDGARPPTSARKIVQDY